MGSGFIIGGIWGLIVSAGALAVASLIGDPPRRDATDVGAVQAPGEAAMPDRAEDGAGIAPETPPGGTPQTPPESMADRSPDASVPSAPDEAETVIELSGTAQVLPGEPSGGPGAERAALPEVPQEPETPGAFDAPDTAPGGSDGRGAATPPPPVSTEAPAAPTGSAAMSETPLAPRSGGDREALPSTPRADVPAGRGAAPSADTAPDARPRAEAGIAAPGGAPEIARTPRIDAGSEEPVLPGPPSRVIEIPANEADIAVVTDSPPPPSQSPRVVAEAEVPEQTVEEQAAEEGIAAAPAEGGAPLAPAAPAGPEQPAPGTITVLPSPDSAERPLPGRVAGLSGEDAVTIRRPGAGTGDAEEIAPAELDEDAPALLRFAAPDMADAGAPRLSVVLVDTGALEAPVAAASSIPFPVTIGIDPEAPDAAARAARWREAGYEIAAMARLPVRATPSDVEVAYEAAFSTLPEAVALLDAGGAGLDSDGDVTAQALDRLARDGRGLVALPHGLATPLRQARARDVPAIEIYRDLGEVGQDDRVIRRFLDQAAFRARQQGSVALLAELNPETITALTLWGNRADREGVAPAPVSTLLRMQHVGPGK
ncbi:divergent polysaccharide deacetylase family protein [Limimaricola sp.]|uniref:divergent polysaccharide deacetylase family protein n=1 Tax=Limimaricola sp. TaxID=2211665 RepID=UPI0040586910